MDDKASLKEAWLRHMTRLIFGGFINISGMAEELSNFVQRETISSLAKGMTNHF